MVKPSAMTNHGGSRQAFAAKIRLIVWCNDRLTRIRNLTEIRFATGRELVVYN
jgi:hypothetical protein